jgi:hypothetical protein
MRVNKLWCLVVWSAQGLDYDIHRRMGNLLQFLIGIFRQNFTLRVSVIRLLKYEHPHIQLQNSIVIVSIIVLMFEFC